LLIATYNKELLISLSSLLKEKRENINNPKTRNCYGAKTMPYIVVSGRGVGLYFGVISTYSASETTPKNYENIGCQWPLWADAWFGAIKSAVALAKKVYKAVLQVKTGHGLFPKKFIDESTLEGSPGGVWIVLESNYEGIP
jgi:hypothetical protein